MIVSIFDNALYVVEEGNDEEDEGLNVQKRRPVERFANCFCSFVGDNLLRGNCSLPSKL